MISGEDRLYLLEGKKLNFIANMFCHFLGHTQKSENIFVCTDKYNNIGKGEYTEEGFLLYKGSICKLELHQGTDKLC